ncbi:MAG: YihY/virulence factor BrkB family protein [Acidimicrobiales bacterium]|nr:YihY/virulence factor BrkB family protein [Acidimicrobiales bacterium]MCB9393544.1 YihY/virulence factor BrkB family protein [Acidimicrobiaceae bacterium]
MSSAAPVPETRDLTGDDARATLRQLPVRTMLRDTASRLRVADGVSHARALAFQLVLAVIPGAIVVVAVAARLQWDALSDALVRTAESIAPGTAGEVFQQAFDEGADAGGAGNWSAIAGGALALLVSGTTAFGQLERTANRVYGIERDRPTVRKYLRALGLMAVSGTMLASYFAAIGLGRGWGSTRSSEAHWWWDVARWPLGLVFVTIALTVVFRWSPKRRQPGWRWLAVGTSLAVSGVVLVSLLLSGYLSASSSFGETYGPLAGFLGLLLWAYLSSVSVVFGLAFAAQLEAVRAGVGDTASDTKVEAGEPDATVVGYAEALRRS